MPCPPLLMITILTGSWFSTIVAQLLGAHHEAPVAVDEHDQPVGPADLGADGRRQAVAHGAEPARGQPVPRVAEAVVLGGPHLVLPHPGDDDAPRPS